MKPIPSIPHRRALNSMQYTSPTTRRLKIPILLAVTCAAASGPAAMASLELLSNGGFESGFAGWTVTAQAGGHSTWYAHSGKTTPLSDRVYTYPTVGAASGLKYAITDASLSGACALSQSFTVSPSSSVVVSFDMFVNDRWQNYPIVSPAGLDYNQLHNQHARVDILLSTANPLSTAVGDTLATLFLPGHDRFQALSPYTHYSIDLTSVLGGGGTYQIRFGEVDTEGPLNVGVDNVSVMSTPVPEPGTCIAGLCALGVLGMCGWRNRQ